MDLLCYEQIRSMEKPTIFTLKSIRNIQANVDCLLVCINSPFEATQELRIQSRFIESGISFHKSKRGNINVDGRVTNITKKLR